MTLRLLQNLNTAFAVEDGYSALKRAITAERAATLGGLGNDVAARPHAWSGIISSSGN
jgi:hypothetical protein